MLQIIIPSTEFYDETNNQFIYSKEHKLQLEHSLVSISKWESKWNKPFLSKKDKIVEETIDYIKCMTITQNVEPSVYNNLTNENIETISKYISEPMTATTFNDVAGGQPNKIITSEIIYYWMITYNIPFKCEKWHLNKLLTLIRVCNTKNESKRKMSKNEIGNRNRELNAKRKRELNTNG